MNINTNANTQKPFFPLTKFLSSSVFFAVKAANDLSILQVENHDISVFNAIQFEELKQNEGFTPMQFDFLRKKKEDLILAYENSTVLHINFLKKEIIKVINALPCNISHKPVSFIVNDPVNSEEFFLIFEDSTMLKYSVKYEENLEFLNKITRFEAKTSFNAATNRFKYRHKDNDLIELKKITLENQPELSFFCALNREKTLKNPISYHKFCCNYITSLTFCVSPFFEKLGAQPSKTSAELFAVMAYAGLDGFLRIFDYFWWGPLISYKTFFGGINQICFSEKGELLGIAGQDDNITILDLLTMRSLVIQGHKSFISKVFITEIEENVIRVIASSFDSFVSISEFDKRVFLLDDDNNVRKEEKIEKSIKRSCFQNHEKMTIKPLYFLKLSNDAIAGFEIFNSFLFVMAFDGVVGVWAFETLDNLRENKGNLQEIEENKAKGPCFIDAQTGVKAGLQETVEDLEGSEEDEEEKSTKIEGNVAC